MDETTKDSVEGDFLYYETADGKLRIQALYEDETMWLSQKKLAELYNVEVPTIGLSPERFFATVQNKLHWAIRQNLKIGYVRGKILFGTSRN